MEASRSELGDPAPDGSGGRLPDQPARHQALRARVISHCAWIATFDRAYAVAAFNEYDRLLPWLEVKKK